MLECLSYLTTPSLAFAMALKYTKVELDLLTGPEEYLLLESGMRGGVSTVSCRMAAANNEFVPNYDPEQEKSFIAYLDANNLYGASMMQSLPVGNFKFLSEDEVKSFDVTKISDESDIGYIILCDLEYPEHLHEKHNFFPLAPEHVNITADMLSPYARSFENDWKPCRKLAPNLMDKTDYVVH